MSVVEFCSEKQHGADKERVLVFGRKKENTSWEGGSAEGNFSLSV